MMRQYLPTVMKYSRSDAEIWVADNASSDDSMQMLERDFPQVKRLQLDKNYGFAEGYNCALRQIETDYYVLLNSDVEVTHGWLTPLIEFMDTHADVAACQPKLLSVFDKDRFEYAGASGGFIDRYGYPFCRGRIFDDVEADDGQYDYSTDVLWATGACLMIRSKDYWKVNGLDGRFFAHNEEINQPHPALNPPARRRVGARHAGEMGARLRSRLRNIAGQPQLGRLQSHLQSAPRLQPMEAPVRQGS